MLSKVDSSSKIEDTIKGLSLKQKLGQMFLVNFVGKYEIPPNIRELNQKGLLGGIIFFSGSNVENIEQLRALTEKIQALRAENPAKLPYLITLDQEGGQLTALHKGATVFPGNMALGDADDPALTRAYARHVGNELSYAGININFAPVLDCSIENRKHGIHIVDNRMLSSDPAVVAVHGVELVEGMQESSVMACAKHYPGMRVAEKDTHHQADIIEYSLEQLEAEYFPAFRQAVAAGVGCVMTHHGVYPNAFDDKPASLSKPAIDFLRKEMGFEGLVITDDLIMHAIQDYYPGVIACEMAINAGVDLIILTGADEHMLDQLVESVHSGKILESTIDAALRRILSAKDSHVSNAVRSDLPSKPAGEKLSLEIARKAVKILKNEGGPNGGPLLPLTAAVLDDAIKVSRHTQQGNPAKISVILANPARLVMSCTVNFYDISLKRIIEEQKLHSYVKETFMPWNPTDEEMLSCFDIGFISDVLVFTTVNAYRFDRQVQILKDIYGLRQKDRAVPKIIAVATRSPDDAQLLMPYADAVLTTGGITESQITALVETLFGKRLQ